MSDLWQPQRYLAFKKERARPFFDLLGYIEPHPDMRILDLGCGTGELSLVAHESLHAANTLAIDNSPTMLAESPTKAPNTFHLRQADIATFTTTRGSFDLVLSNAALHWLPDHPRLFERLAAFLAEDGQLAVQMPANEIHPSHWLANKVAAEATFAHELAGYQRRTPVLTPKAYDHMLTRLGFSQVRCEYRTYRHKLTSTAAVVDWVRSTLLTDYERRMSAEAFARFVVDYRERLLSEVGEVNPYFFEYRRLFLWGIR